MKTKVCSKCQIEKALDCFYKQKDGRMGKTSACKECTNRRVSEYKVKNPDKVKETKKKEYIRHSDKYKKRAKDKYWSDPSASIQYVNEWRRKNPEKFSELNKRNKRTEAGRKNIRSYRERHRARLNERSAKRIRDGSSSLSDQYIRGVICSKTNLRQRDVPNQLVEAKRVQLQIHRLLKESKQ